MPDIDNNLEGMHQELRDLATAIMRQDPPLDQRAKAIAEAKILTLQRQIKTLEDKFAKG
jgi:hypothetical protein